jgi:formimidoylglutamate deiminase
VDSTAAALLDGASLGGAAATGLGIGGIAVGQRADLCVMDADAPALAGMPKSHTLDAWAFSSPSAVCAATVVAGQAVPAALPGVQAGYIDAMRRLWT